MAIEFPGHSPTQLSSAKEESRILVGRTEPSAPKQQTGKPVTTETVTLTDTAAQLRKLEGMISILPVVDTGRVEDVKQALKAGTYEFNPERIAMKMASFERELGNLQ